jgi:hypothetical protein
VARPVLIGLGAATRTAGQGRTQSQAIDKSKGGMTTKILALTDALGKLVRFVLLPGQCYETVGVAPLIDGVEFGALVTGGSENTQMPASAHVARCLLLTQGRQQNPKRG